MHDENLQDAVEQGHEPIALSATAVAKGFLVLFVVVAGSLLLMGGLMRLLSGVEGGDATVNAPADAAPVQPGVPQLNANQRSSLRALRAKEAEVLLNYRWVDANAGVAQIPIKRAMEIMSANRSNPSEAASDENSQPQ